MNSYKRFITTGCSFSVQGWPYMVHNTIATPEMFNFAIGGGSNRAALNHLIQYLELYPSPGEDTLVGFNITGLGRQDLICDRTSDQSAIKSRTDVTELLHSSIIYTEQNKLPVQAVRNASEIDIIQAITYLESKHIRYFFMFMSDRDYVISRPLFQQFIQARAHNWVQFDQHKGMAEYAAKKGLSVSDTDLHPSEAGHQAIAKHIIEFLENGQY